MIDAPHERQECGGREVDDALGLQQLRQIGEMRGEQQHDEQQHGRGERPAHGGGAHRAEDAGRDDRGGGAEREAERAEQHIGGEDRIARLDENRKTQDHVRQRTEGGGGDGQRGDEIGRIQQGTMIMPCRGDASREDHDDEHRNVKDHATP